ncbi:peroxisomal leader peptide-processing protease [Chanos chanos]|uniref:Peroxisomal leader peptide-processing protease n=1 Tax=Chanos chanos TaxID=29144 RepID=A0A6J2V6W1_CHACN|nr:peroxisomal leader peptide-processing protease [Chanos chanos]
MKSIEGACCVITVSELQQNQSHIPTIKPRSCSGAIVNLEPGIVICNALLFSPFINDTVLGNDQKIVLANNFNNKIQICVHYTGHQGVISNECADKSSVVEGPSVSHLEARLVLLVNCVEFKGALQRIFKPSDKWSFYGGDEDADALRDLHFLSWFAVLKVPTLSKYSQSEPVPWVNSTVLEKGCSVLACGSPFGSFCPDLFMSTLSKGIVSNLAGEENALILTDARCLPGTEGGGLFVKLPDTSCLVGLIVSPLCWKSSEWIGLTLVCSLHLILRNVAKSLKSHHPLRELLVKPSTEIRQVPLKGQQESAPLNYPMVVLVETGQLWGSGVLLSSSLVLTCRHVVNGKSRLTVRFNTNGRRSQVASGQVLYSTKESSPYDIALVQFQEPLSDVTIPEFATFFSPGEDVIVLGYGAFGENLGPSMTSGILSRAVTFRSKAVMLQTTCAVQAGASGGAVVRAATGELLGLVSSNTRDFSAKVTYPHLNFSIPVTVLEPLLHVFARTGDAAAFQALDAAEDGVRRVWRLQATPSKL